MSAPTVAGQSRKEAAVAFLTLIIAGRIQDAFATYAAPGLRHHNPWFQGDAASLQKGMQENEAQFPGKRFDIQRALEDGELVAVHSRLKFQPEHAGIAVVHLFQFEGGKIAELWDVAQEVPKEIVNEHGMF